MFILDFTLLAKGKASKYSTIHISGEASKENYKFIEVGAHYTGNQEW